jgi:hypothetical protein
MDTLLTILILVTAISGIVGLLWGLLAAFERSVGWGLLSLLLAPAGVIAFLVMTCRENYRPLALIGGALLLGIITVFLAASTVGS